MSRRFVPNQPTHKLISAFVIVALAGAVIGCHPLINPADPRSTAFTGEASSDDESQELPRILPEVTRWEIVAEHNPGQIVGFEIPQDGSFIEPRIPSGSPAFYVVVTFDGPIREDQFAGAICFGGYNTTGGSIVHSIGIDRILPERNQVRLAIPGPPPEARARIKIVDANGFVSGAINMSFLAGDVNGDGTVDTAADATDPGGLNEYDGMLADPNRPMTLRSDVDTSGTVDGNGGVDEALVTNNEGNTLSGLAFPDF